MTGWCAAAMAQPAGEGGRGLSNPPVLAPTAGRRADAAPSGDSEWKPAAGQLVREGAFLRNRRGRLVRREASWVFVFDADAEGQAEPPMAVLPCRRLREMQQTAELRTGTVTFQVTGQVFAYDGRNYFLPTFFGVYAAERPTVPIEAVGEGSPAQRDPGVNELLRDMSSGPRPAIAPRSSNVASEGAGDSAAPLREGVTLVSRRGRVVRDGGQLTFVTDTGSGTEERPIPPLALLPCLNLESIDRTAQRRGERTVILMSGRVFAYEGRNYLLPTFFLIETDREGNLMPAH